MDKVIFEDSVAEFRRLCALCGGEKIAAEIEKTAREDGRETAEALTWMYASSPVSDWLNFPFSLFYETAHHGLFLRETAAKDIPEDIFRNYILHPRVNDEELSPCRELFYDLLAPELEGLSPEQAVLAANYWCAGQVTYRFTDTRTASALTVYRAGYGRCGEESVFCVNVLRAVGIPARQVYVPRWSHCDDNHAWVEVYVNGQWHYFGACEPEERLDRGWFSAAAGRAMMVYSRCFGDIPQGEEVLFRMGKAAYLNHTARYAPVKEITLRPLGKQGQCLPETDVTLEIFNMGELFPFARLKTDGRGEAAFRCGLGSLGVRTADVQKIVNTGDRTEDILDPEDRDRWQPFSFFPPEDAGAGTTALTREEQAAGKEKNAAAAERRQQRKNHMLDRKRVEALGDGGRVTAILRKSRGNSGELLDFLEDELYPEEEKEKLLLTLSAKDLCDVTADILRECMDGREAGSCPTEIFYPYVLCPRVETEPLSLYRKALRGALTDQNKQLFRRDPGAVWKFLNERVVSHPQGEYCSLVTLPAAALSGGCGSSRSRKILFVALCRSLGIPARLHPQTGAPEFYRNGGFRPVEPVETGKITLVRTQGEIWSHGSDYTLARLRDGEYEILELSRERWEGDYLTIDAPSGDYRVLTENRLPNGVIHGGAYHFHLAPGGGETIFLRKSPADLRQMLENIQLDNFYASDAEGELFSGETCTKDGGVLAWLDPGREPTEHLLNEILAEKEQFRELPVTFFLDNGTENETLQKVLEALPGAMVCLDGGKRESMARRVYADPDKAPLVLLCNKPNHVVMAWSGYRVGAGKLILEIMDISREKDRTFYIRPVSAPGRSCESSRL